MSYARPDRAVFCGNFEYEAEERDIVRLFERFGPVEKIDMKTGFAFVYMRYRDDGDAAVRRLDRSIWGVKRRPLRVEWAQHKDLDAKRDALRPSKTLFVVNFDARRTTEHYLEDVFSRFGRVTRVQIKNNYAFVAFTDVASAERALDATHGAPLDGRTLTVEYVQNEGPAALSSPRRGRGRSPPRVAADGAFGRWQDVEADRYDQGTRGGGGGGGGGYGYNYRSRSRSRGRSRSRDRELDWTRSSAPAYATGGRRGDVRASSPGGGRCAGYSPPRGGGSFGGGGYSSRGASPLRRRVTSRSRSPW